MPDRNPRPSPASNAARASSASGEASWRAVAERDCSADGAFVYAVASTGIYCRPSCPSKRPRRANVRFFETPEAAEAAGFRPCKRCTPRAPSLTAVWQKRIETACRAIESAEEALSLGALARLADMSPHHFHRRFKEITGVTPKAYAAAVRSGRLRRTLPGAPTVTVAALDAGFNSSGRFYASAKSALGMAPARYKSGGAGLTLRVAATGCRLGRVLVAATDVGIAAIFLGDEDSALRAEVERRFPKAAITPADRPFNQLLARVVALIDRPAPADLPLDIQGTAFEQKVWKALQAIPLGTTATYTEIAAKIGAPASVRAVARACAANRIAVAIPCHRVLRSDGHLAGYRWGLERKQKLLEQEAKIRGTAGSSRTRRVRPRSKA